MPESLANEQRRAEATVQILLLVAHVAQAALAMPPATRKRARVPAAVKVLSEDAIERPQKDRGYRLSGSPTACRCC